MSYYGCLGNQRWFPVPAADVDSECRVADCHISIAEKKGLHMSIWHMYSCHGSTLLQPTSHEVDVVVVAEVMYCSLIAD